MYNNSMLSILNEFLNRTTMYKVLAYGLLLLVLQGIILTIFKFLPFDLVWISLSLIVITLSCYVSNGLIARLFNIPTNIESALITGLILFLIIQPASRPSDLLAIFLIGLLAMAAKYIFMWNRLHIFNPAAIAALLGGFLFNYYATWWVGNTLMLPLVFIVGVLIVKKIRRFTMIGIFLLTASIIILISDFSFLKILTAWPIIFFATVMLTEPLTMPGTKKIQLLYATFIGIIFGLRFNLGWIISTPELALVLGNILFFVIKPRSKFVLVLKEKIQLAPDIYEFVFKSNRKINHIPGQYIEWTIPHKKADSRGKRRFFTIASSPTEDEIKLGVRVNKESSSFKNALLQMQSGSNTFAAHVAGDFILDESSPSVFIAGGIGVTPFRSIIKYLSDTNKQQKVDLFYFVRKPEDFVYKDIFDLASQKIGIHVHYIVSDSNTNIEKLIKDHVKDYSRAKYYISGPSAMVDSYKKILKLMKIDRNKIVTDYFPGY